MIQSCRTLPYHYVVLHLSRNDRAANPSFARIELFTRKLQRTCDIWLSTAQLVEPETVQLSLNKHERLSAYIVETGCLFTGEPEELEQLFHGSFSNPDLLRAITDLFNRLQRFQDAQGMQLAAHAQNLISQLCNSPSRSLLNSPSQFFKEAATPSAFRVSDEQAVKLLSSELVLSLLDSSHQGLLKQPLVKIWLHACLIHNPVLASKFINAGWKPDMALLLRYDLIRIKHDGKSFKLNISPRT